MASFTPTYCSWFNSVHYDAQLLFQIVHLVPRHLGRVEINFSRIERVRNPGAIP